MRVCVCLCLCDVNTHHEPISTNDNKNFRSTIICPRKTHAQSIIIVIIIVYEKRIIKFRCVFLYQRGQKRTKDHNRNFRCVYQLNWKKQQQYITIELEFNFKQIVYLFLYYLCLSQCVCVILLFPLLLLFVLVNRFAFTFFISSTIGF